MLVLGLTGMLSMSGMANEGEDENTALPVPEYPLTETFIDETIQEVGLSWDARVAQQADVMENQTMYELYNDEERMIASLSSYTDENGRFLMVSFMPPQLEGELVAVAEEKDWEAAMVLAAKLYGGLETEEQIAQDFVSDFEAEATIMEREEKEGGTPTYAVLKKMIKEYGDVNCRILLGYSDDTETAQRYLHTITLCDDENIMNLDGE